MDDSALLVSDKDNLQVGKALSFELHLSHCSQIHYKHAGDTFTLLLCHQHVEYPTNSHQKYDSLLRLGDIRKTCNIYNAVDYLDMSHISDLIYFCFNKYLQTKGIHSRHFNKNLA